MRSGSGVIWTIVAVVALAAACGVRETAEQRVTRIRQQYDVKPTGFQPRTGADGEPELAVDVLVLNRGKESLKTLTLVLDVVGSDGKTIVRKPVSFDVGDLVPGVTSQVSAIVPGVALKEGDQVMLELESAPDAAERAAYPEYRAPS
jgi:hypothetical protein